MRSGKSVTIDPGVAGPPPVAAEPRPVEPVEPAEPAVVPGDRRRPGLPAALVRTARPRQWVKNVLVFAAPGAAGVLTQGDAMARSLVALAAFCLVSSGTYFLNDAVDCEADRLHPLKRHRPVAAGVVSVALARLVAATLLAAGFALAFAVGWRLALTIGVYVAVTVSYSLWLKTEPVLELAAIAAGFVIRAIAGGVAVGVPISNWFLIVASFGSLFMAAGKRHAEFVELGDERGSHRAVLDAYSVSFLNYVRAVSSGIAITAYCLWAFEKADLAVRATWFQLSIVPFVLGILRYALLLDAGKGGAPEDVVLGDRVLQVLGLVWVVVFALGVKNV